MIRTTISFGGNPLRSKAQPRGSSLATLLRYAISYFDYSLKTTGFITICLFEAPSFGEWVPSRTIFLPDEDMKSLKIQLLLLEKFEITRFSGIRFMSVCLNSMSAVLR
jgi:hypothetical protein